MASDRPDSYVELTRPIQTSERTDVSGAYLGGQSGISVPSRPPHCLSLSLCSYPSACARCGGYSVSPVGND